MKKSTSAFLAALLTTSICLTGNEHKVVAALPNDLQPAVELENLDGLDIVKYEIDFANEGLVRLDYSGFGTKGTRVIDVPSKAATLIVYLERGPKSAGSKVVGIDTLHYWLKAKGHEVYSYLTFKREDATSTTADFEDDTFQITAGGVDENSNDFGYSLKVTCSE